jgi:plasmid stabilization system protein ParE
VFKIIVSPLAWDDIFEIFEYIARDNRDAAGRFCDALPDHADLLATFPHLGIVAGKSLGFRRILHTPVRVYDRVDDVRQSVESDLPGTEAVGSYSKT